jgi:hemerythrin-like metal-binding protein
MPVVIWNDSYKTGNGTVDQEHRMLFALVNEFHDAVVSGRGKDVLLPTLTRLADYTVNHFAHEERLMLSARYPGYPAHKKAHDELTTKAKQIIVDYRGGKLVLTMTLSRFLADWIANHINTADMAMITWVQRKSRPTPEPSRP